MNFSRVFGYGSLVNPATHNYAGLTPATLEGWERIWLHRDDRPFARLSVRKRTGSVIRGIVAETTPDDWPALEEREAGYDKKRVSANLASGGSADVCLFVIPEAAPAEPRAILLSYLDTVLAGFEQHFPGTGIGDFFKTTGGWDGPVFDDRSDPRYARHQPADDDLVNRIDLALASRGIDRVTS